VVDGSGIYVSCAIEVDGGIMYIPLQSRGKVVRNRELKSC
jgi:hypothetical protein